ncbi:MAG: hypothetical protein R3F14_34745 [Polyangiaceae bacterium]
MKALPLFGRLSLLAALSATPACFAPAFVPRIDLGGSGPDPHTTYTAIELDDGTTVKVGVETGGKDYRPWIARFGADEKPVWQRTFARMGQGGNAIITSAAVLADGSIAAALADKSVTTLAMVAVEPDGHLRWALELDLPERAEARARILPTHDGALALVPVHGDGDARIVVVRTDLQGKVLWSYSYGPLVDVTAATWSETSGLTFTGHDLRPREALGGGDARLPLRRGHVDAGPRGGHGGGLRSFALRRPRRARSPHDLLALPRVRQPRCLRRDVRRAGRPRVAHDGDPPERAPRSRSRP